MSRYIDADVLVKRLYGMPVYRVTILDVMHFVDDTPTADVVEVVRCKDCKYHEQDLPGMVYCPETVGGWVDNDWFCKGGERRE